LQTGDREDLIKKVSVAQEMLGRVIHTTDNLDEKVGRIFSSMSFLTVGGTILYTSFVADHLSYFVGRVDMVTLLFVLFIVAVALSTSYMLQAMGPRFHINPWKRGSESDLYMKPTPTGYADKIASMKEDEWNEFVHSTPIDAFYEKWYAEGMKEVYLLSKKVDRKVREMRRAQWFFLLSIAFLVLMVLAGASTFL